MEDHLQAGRRRVTTADRIKTVRSALRLHRDQKGDDRCWVDDWFVWAALEDQPPEPAAAPSFEEGMKKCHAFYERRRADTADVVPANANHDPQAWDADLAKMNEAQREAELERLLAAIRKHRDAGSLTADDDRALYRTLPENLPADFRLPPREEFLGEAKAPRAGCPSFWRSHANCPGAHDLHRWGPCKAAKTK
jgi:hypothetical protein